MPFPMKIQPLDSLSLEDIPPNRLETVKPSAVQVKSRLKRIFDLQFLRNSTAVEKVAEETNNTLYSKDSSTVAEFEPSSFCLAKMVQNFIEENPNEKQSAAVAARCGRNRCNCFNANDSSEEEFDLQFGSNLSSSGDAIAILKSLVPYNSVYEKNLVADIEKIVEKNNIAKRKDDFCRKVVADGLLALGYDSSICKSHWENSSSYPAGEYEYVDVIIEGEMLIVDIDFRSEFEIARSTKVYKSILQVLPLVFVGKSDRLAKIISIVSEASKQSLKKKGMHIPPWRKEEYVKAKWLSSHIRAKPAQASPGSNPDPEKTQLIPLLGSEEIQIDDKSYSDESIFDLSESYEEEQKKTTVVPIEWKVPEPKLKPKSLSLSIGIKAVSGLASIIEDDP
jgi:uncharacterized protein (TIGR01615 family)